MLEDMTASTRPLASRFVVLTATALLSIALAGAAIASAGATTPSAKSPSVTIKNFAFSPKTLQVKAGSKVTVKNKDDTTHTFTANKGAFDAGEIDGGSSATITVKKPGTYAYHCNIHNFMKGTIKAT